MSRRRPTKADDRPVKLTLQLPAELARRFGVHAEMMNMTRSDLFAELVKAGCRRFVVHDHGREPIADQGEQQGRGGAGTDTPVAGETVAASDAA